jgi:hypothetical protein
VCRRVYSQHTMKKLMTKHTIFRYTRDDVGPATVIARRFISMAITFRPISMVSFIFMLPIRRRSHRRGVGFYPDRYSSVVLTGLP